LKVKINKRMIKIASVCLILTVALTFFIYNSMKKSMNPEPKRTIAYFTRDLEADTIISSKDVVLKNTPISLITDGAVEDAKEVQDKRLIMNVKKGEAVLSTKLTERGDLRVDTNKMWTIGIDVKDISNFLGVQLKLGDYYALVFKGEATTRIMNKIKIVGIVDATGKEILSSGSGVPKTINVAVGSMEEMIEISDSKLRGMFEIIKPPKDWEFTWKPPEELEEVEVEGDNITNGDQGGDGI